MKKIHSIIISCGLILGLASCSESDFADRYPDPSQTPNASIDKLMTGVFREGNKYTMPWYERYFSFETQQMGRWTQTLGWLNGETMYEGLGESYNDWRWRDFNKVLSNFRILEDLYSKIDDKLKNENKIFVNIAQIFVYDQLHQMIDMWGDIPYTKAGYLPVSLDIKTSKAPYDKAEDLYKMMLKDLKDINASISSTPLTGLAAKQLKNQDYINKGDVSKWRKYCNSLRLRIASRIADQGTLAAEGRAVIQEILSNPATYPLVEKNSENILINAEGPDLLAIDNHDPDGIKDGFESWNGQCNRASKAMVEALTNDPRLEVIYDKNAEGLYVGMDPLMSETEQQRLFDRKKENGGNYFSAVDSATFSRNNYFPGILFTAAEIDFIKAEAYTKWGVAGDAKTAFVSGINKSVEFYYYLNGLSKFRSPIAAPTTDAINSLANRKWDAEANKSKAIAIEKWIHFGNIQMVQTWAEVRKTGYPELTFREDVSTPRTPRPPYRLLYTSSERNLNEANYQVVQPNDNSYKKLFWAK